MILNDDGRYWRIVRRMSFHDTRRYAGIEKDIKDMKDFVTLFGNGRVFAKPGWLLVVTLEGEFTQYPIKDVAMLRFGRGLVLQTKKSAFTRMREILTGADSYVSQE